MVNLIQILAILVSIFTYMCWDVILNRFDIPIFYIGNALFIFLICVVNYLLSNKKLLSFLLICLSLNNLLDETLFSNTTIGINEIILTILMPFIWYIKILHNARQNNKQ